MPELPEVETIRQYLETEMVGLSITAVSHLDGRMIKLGDDDADGLSRKLLHRQLIAVERRGKYLLFGWRPRGYLIIHLGMTGRLTVHARLDSWRAHTHMVLDFGERQLRLSDPRRFGRIGWLQRRTWLDHRLGLEPLSQRFTGHTLWRCLQGRSQAIKSLLLNQSVIAGLGNIYADEALYLSRLHPLRRAGDLDLATAARLARSVRKVLRQSLDHRGTSFSDYVDALGQEGGNQDHLFVYGRQGQPCLRCQTAIVTVVLQGRTSHFCPTCQT